MTLSGVVRLLLALALGVMVGAAAAVMTLPRADLGYPAAAVPGEQRLNGWQAAIPRAGIPLYAPREERPTAVIVHGVAGDASRPVEARFLGGLTLVQAHRDVLPADNVGVLVSVPGADDAWWQEASDARRLAVRFGETLVLLSGRPDEELVAVAATLIRLDSGQ